MGELVGYQVGQVGIVGEVGGEDARPRTGFRGNCYIYGMFCRCPRRAYSAPSLFCAGYPRASGYPGAVPGHMDQLYILVSQRPPQCRPRTCPMSPKAQGAVVELSLLVCNRRGARKLPGRVEKGWDSGTTGRLFSCLRRKKNRCQHKRTDGRHACCWPIK